MYNVNRKRIYINVCCVYVSFSFGEVFGEKTQPTKEEFDDYYAVTRYNDGHLVMHE